MRTGLKKHQKITEIWFHEGEQMIHVHTYNADLRNRILKKAKQYPQKFVVTDIEDDGSIRAEIAKGRISFRLTEPYSDKRRKAMSELAYAQYENGKGISRQHRL